MHFFHMFEAANRHFESILDLRRQSSHIENATVLAHLTPQISGGGYFQDVMYLIQKYGLVPESSMPATINTLQTDAVMAELQDYLQKKSYELWNLTEKVSGSKTTPYTRMMSQRFEGKGKDGIDLPKLTEKQNEKLEKAKKEMLKGVWKILEASFGRPPSKFKMKVSSPDQTIPASKYVSLAVEVKEFTPQEFAAKYIGFDANDFVTVSNLVNRPTGKLYSTKFSDTPLPLKLLNLSPARMRELVTQMIDRGFPVWFAADMGPGVDNTSGVMHPALKNVKGMFSFSKSEAPKPISNSEDDFLGNIQGNHAMIFVKYDKPVGASSVIKFGVENSWGVDAGSQGIYHMYPEWFDKYVEHIIVPLGLLTAEERAIYTGQAMKLSPRTGYH
jgi:bleomycin hydrolase